MSSYLKNIIAASSRLSGTTEAELQADIERQAHLFVFSTTPNGRMLSLTIGQTVTGHLLDADVDGGRRMFLKLVNERYATLVVEKIIGVARDLVGDSLVIENQSEVSSTYAEFYDKMLFGEFAANLPPHDLDEDDTPPESFEGLFFITIRAYLTSQREDGARTLVIMADCGKWIKKDPPDENLYPVFFETFGLSDEPEEKPFSYGIASADLFSELLGVLNDDLKNRGSKTLTNEEDMARCAQLRAKLRKLLD